jgi:adenylosuccinate synthase
LIEIKFLSQIVLYIFVLVCISANLSDFGRIKVKYITLDGWQSSITNARQFSELPKNAQKYVQTIEQLVEVPGIQSIQMSAYLIE